MLNFDKIFTNYEIDKIISCHQINIGLINQSFLIATKNKKYVLQLINTEVFLRIDILESNFQNLTAHLIFQQNTNFKGINFIRNKKNNIHTRVGDKVFRLMEYIDHKTFNKKNIDATTLFEMAKNLGNFHNVLNASNIQIKASIPNFLDFDSRINLFQKALKLGNIRRIEEASCEIEFCIKYAEVIALWKKETSAFNSSIIHGDPKWNNFLLNDHGKVISFVDWDTIMPGFIHYDVGDLVRSSVLDVEENEIDIEFKVKRFESILEGYKASEYYSKLTKRERAFLDICALPIIYIQALRFVTDFIFNDIYYLTNYENENLDKSKNHIKLFQRIYVLLEEKDQLGFFSI